MQYQLRGGEDYALVFTVAPAKWLKVKAGLPAARVIGRMTPAKEGIRAVQGKKIFPLTSYGYAHF